MSKRVCFITKTEGFGGLEIHTLSLIKFLNEKGYRVELICCRHSAYDQSINRLGIRKIVLIHFDCDTHILSRKESLRWRVLLQKIRSQIVIIPKGSPGFGDLKFFLYCRRRFRHVYFIEHLMAKALECDIPRRKYGGCLKGLGLWRYKEILVRMARAFMADRIVAVSQEVKDSLVRYYYYPEKKIDVVRNGVRWQNFQRNIESGNSFRDQHQIPRKFFVFGMMTRLSPEKGVDVALNAYRKLCEEHQVKRSVLVIAGSGPEKEKLMALAGSLLKEKRVLFVDFIDNPLEAYSAFDVIVFPSRLEGLPLALLESMAAGCLPIVTTAGGMKEVVQDGVNGWIIPCEDVYAMIQKMLGTISLDSRRRLEMVKNAQDIVRTSFDANKSYEKIAVFFGLIKATNSC